jgi:ketosteroid isomerase-like protein
MSPKPALPSARIAAPNTAWHLVQLCTLTRLPTLPVIFATPEEAELAFYDALERADLPRLMQVWAEDEEVICVHPGGLRVVGLHAVKESWQEILANGGLRIRPSMTVSSHSMMGAVHSLIEQISVKSADGTEVAHCYATNVYHKGPTGWKLVMHHASAAPVEAGMLDLHDKPGLLH